jgi:hypothetical protein
MGCERMNPHDDLPRDWRDEIIATAREQADARRYQETLIAQKVGEAHRAAFKEKFPGQVEHCMRLIAERLQKGLAKDAEVGLSDCSAKDLSWALRNLYTIHQDLTRE